MSVSPNNLTTPIIDLPGVGSARANLLQRIGIRTVADAIFCFPRTYQDLSTVRLIAQLEEGQEASVQGVIDEIELRNTTPGRSVLGMLFRDETGSLRGVWFNQTYLLERFRRGQRVLVSGKPRRKSIYWEMIHPRVQNLEQTDETTVRKISAGLSADRRPAPETCPGGCETGAWDVGCRGGRSAASRISAAASAGGD